MAIAPSPGEIFDRAAEEGERRLDQSAVELVATSFIAGFTVVLGIVALGAVHALVEPRFQGLGRIGGALAFGIGLVFLVVGRAELFNENFFDPVAAAVDADSWPLRRLLRLWVVTFVFNFAGGVLFGVFYGASIGPSALVETTAVVTAGNFVGGLGLVTFTHVAQWKGAQQSDG